MKITVHDSEGTKYPNLALMKLSAYRKKKGDHVEWFNPLFGADRVYSSKVFTFTPDNPYLPKDTIKGGTGYGVKLNLSDEVEHCCPDYDLYNCKESFGFLTRGCPNKCTWCFVPEKEGKIRAHADIEEFARHENVVLMDNNVLAHEHGISQIEKIVKLKLKVDFNQGLDARLIDNSVAKLLGRVKWSHPVRLACDSSSQIEPVRKAVELLRWHNVTPSQFFCYVLVKEDIKEALEIVRFLKGLYVYPFAQPYRDKEGTEPTAQQKHFARWVCNRVIFRTTTWEDYKYNKN